MKNVIYLLSIPFLLGIASCKKEGLDGLPGPKGEQGDQGQQGIQGEKGIPGSDGKMVRYGAGDPASELGNEGDFYINTVDQTLFGPKSSSGWGTGTALKGNDGEKGDQGNQGEQGEQGEKGEKGDNGERGSQFLSGTKNPVSGDGSISDFYFNMNSGTIFGPKTSNGWGSGVSLLGNVNVNQGIGWVVLDEINGNSSTWKRSSQIPGGSNNSGEPGDIGEPFVYNWWLGSMRTHSGVTLVYIDDGSISRMTPFKKEVYKEVDGDVVIDAVLEFRFAMTTTSYSVDWYMYPIIAVKSGTVDDSYLINTYVKSLKWKAVNIPANVMKNKNIDFNDYNAVKKALNLKD